MAAVHRTTENSTSCEFPIMKMEIDFEAEMDYSCTFNTHEEPDVKDKTILSSRSTEGLYSDNIPFQVNDRAHINIIDMYEQTSCEYRAFFIYEDLFSTYVVLRPLKEVPGSVNSVPEIATKLMDIFSLIGAPRVLESSNGRNFAEMLVKELRKKVPALKTIHENISRQNYSRRDFKTLVQSWQMENPSKLWHEGLHFIQVHENICNFSSSQSETSQNSPAEIFFKANLVNDLVRFVSDNNFIEAVDEIRTEEECLRKTKSHKSSIPSLMTSNNFIDGNDEEQNAATSNSINSVKNEILSQTEKDSIDSIDEASNESWTEEKCLDRIIKNNLCETLAEEKLDAEREVVKWHEHGEIDRVYKPQTNILNDETCHKNVKSYKALIPASISLNKLFDSNDEEQNVSSSNSSNSLKNEVPSGTKKDSVDAKKCNVTKNDTFKCHICDRIFGKMCNLKNHMRSHKTTLRNREKHADDAVSEETFETGYDENLKGVTNSHTQSQRINVEKENDSDVENEINSGRINSKRRSSRISLFSNRKTIKLSKIKNPRKKSYRCYICEKKYPSLYTLRRHMSATHQSKMLYKCEICDKTLKDLSVFTRHKLIHSNERPFPCHLCKKRFKRNSDFHSHLLVHSDVRPFECDVCKSTFKQKSGLRRHIVSVHINIRSFKCNSCKATFTSTPNLQRHIACVHKNIRSFKCGICKATVHRKDDLLRHVLGVHTNIRRFKCSICGATFKHKPHLQRHIVRVHESIRPFKCDMCEATFNQKLHLQRHIVSVHVNIRPFKCDICRVFFSSKYNLQRHIVCVHESIRPFKCDMCETTFKQKLHLQRHIVSVHVNIRPFKVRYLSSFFQ